ncbi:MAG: DUF2094 domain-containing protein [Acidobacteria bacterium]|nr:DUF2094 domain-containing protein [Acidobacteriota bacterium]
MTAMENQYLPLGCFGKLPCYGDFLEGSVFFPTSRALKEWILESRKAIGLEGAENNEEGKSREPRETLGCRFLYGLPGSMELVAGVIRPSSDQGGRRYFPFSVFVHFPRRLYGRNHSLLPMALGPVWQALDETWDNLGNVATRAAFQEVVGSTMIPGPLPIAEVRTAYQGMHQETINPTFERCGARVEDFLRNMPEVVAQLRKGTEPDRLRLELPASSGGDAAGFEASFWIDLLNHQFIWRRFEPSVFLQESPGKETSRFLMLFGILTATDYPLIMGSEGTVGKVLRPARPSDSSGGPPAHDEKPITYAEVLARRFTAGSRLKSDAAQPEAIRGADEAS